MRNLMEAFVDIIAGEDARCDDCSEFFMHCECLEDAHEHQLEEYERLAREST